MTRAPPDRTVVLSNLSNLVTKAGAARWPRDERKDEVLEINDGARWLRVRDAARVMSVSESTIRRWLLREKLAGFKIDGVVRINRDAIEEMVEAHRYSGAHRSRRISALLRVLRQGRAYDPMG